MGALTKKVEARRALGYIIYNVKNFIDENMKYHKIWYYERVAHIGWK